VTVSRSPDKFHPAIAFELSLQLQGVTNLVQLKLYYFVVLVAIGVNVCENGMSLLFLALGNQESRALWDEPDEGDLKKGRERLGDGRDTPRPVVVDVESAKGKPCNPGQSLDLS